jgi:preprotein translocase subunit YajC
MFKINDNVKVIATGATGNITSLTDTIEVRMDETVEVKRFREEELELADDQDAAK